MGELQGPLQAKERACVTTMKMAPPPFPAGAIWAPARGGRPVGGDSTNRGLIGREIRPTLRAKLGLPSTGVSGQGFAAGAATPSMGQILGPHQHQRLPAWPVGTVGMRGLLPPERPHSIADQPVSAGLGPGGTLGQVLASLKCDVDSTVGT